LVVLQTLRTFRQVLILPYVVSDIFLRYLLPTDWQTASARNDRERINRARQDAEDLFKPTQRITRADVPPSAPNDALSAEHQPRRQPRIFAIPSVAPMTTVKVEPAAEPKVIRRSAAIKREARDIPACQFGRVRALTNYGMTQAQVADLYEVTIGEIDRIIRNPS
jgi:hypothetical protein